MFEILKRTTAIAALTALPLAPVAADDAKAAKGQEQTQATQNADSRTSGSESTQAGSPAEAEEKAAADGDDVVMPEDTAQRGRSLEDQNRGAVPPDQAQAERGGAAAGGETEQAQGAQPGMTDQGGTPEVLQGRDTVPGVTPGQPPAQQQAGTEEDALIATVGDAEIRRSDVMGALAQLPPQLQQQPAEMLIPLAIDQLVTRELILQEAREAGLEQDEEVQGMLSADALEEARENAMVQVWLRRQLEDRVTEEKVNEAYEGVKTQFGDQAPPLADVRPQIENELRQQAFAEISTDLQADAEITVYGPDGQPVAE